MSTPSRLLLLAALATLAASAHAASLTYTFTSDVYGNSTGGGTVPSFDPSLGTLTSVATTSSVDANLFQTIDNHGASHDFEMLTGVNADFLVADANLYVLAEAPSGDAADDFPTIDQGGSFTSSLAETIVPSHYVDAHGNSNPTGRYTDPAILARFSGGGPLQVIDYATPNVYYDASSAFGLNIVYQEGGNAVVTSRLIYTYTPVPEPGAFAALALGGLALLRRRRMA